VILFLRISIKKNLRTKIESMKKKNVSKAKRTGSIVKRKKRWTKKKRKK